ncbi:hypothetical protein CPB83DRAFT_888779 [Crepidotus variabilis]|uniref:RRM domain-containing protein n=1 Tax=Crepidotus variabilis TaxID=179855 RepID=A0A9P6ERL7_9AGAR|nr:hypothetical protein CPB83DRAFT_888779 [Crepidotus variabilis]
MAHVMTRRLYLRGLHSDVSTEDLHKFLSCYGVITEIKLLPHCAFVQFESETAASVVLDTYQSQPLLGNRVTIEYSRPLRKKWPSIQSSNSSENRLWSSKGHGPSARYRHPVVVKGIPPGICWQELKDFGRLSGSLVAFCDIDKAVKERGFIEYFSREDAKRAERVLNGKKLGGHSVRVFGYEETDGESRRCLGEVPRSYARALADAGNSKTTHNKNKESLAYRWPVYGCPRTPDNSRDERWIRHASYGPHDAYDSRGVRESYEGASSNFERIVDWAHSCRRRDSDQNHGWAEHLDGHAHSQFGGNGGQYQSIERPFDPYQ